MALDSCTSLQYFQRGTNAGEHNSVNNYSRITRREHIGDQGIRPHGGTVFLASSPQSMLVATGGGLMRP